MPAAKETVVVNVGNSNIKTRKIRRLVIEEDRLGDWRIRLYFDKGRCKLLGQTYDTHHNACLAASGVPLQQNWFPLEVSRAS
jgi:hypothetical protein